MRVCAHDKALFGLKPATDSNANSEPTPQPIVQTCANLATSGRPLLWLSYKIHHSLSQPLEGNVSTPSLSYKILSRKPEQHNTLNIAMSPFLSYSEKKLQLP